MNGNKKSAKQYHQSVITALEKKVNDMIAVSIVCMLYFAKKVKTVNEVEEEKKFWPNFFIQWATSLGYINMPVAVIAILVTFDKGKAWTLFMMGVAVILTGLTLIEALVKTSKILKKVSGNKID